MKVINSLGQILNSMAGGGGGGGGATFSAGVSTGGNTLGTTGTVSGQLVLVGGDKIVLSQSINGGSATVTISGSPQNILISAGTTSAASSQFTFSNSNNVSFGIDNGTVTATATVATSLSNIRISAGTTSNLLSAVTFSNANGISFGLNASTVTASVATSLTNINVSAGTTSNNLSALTFSNANGVSFGLNASTVTGSVAAQTNQTLGLYAVSNTTGQSSSSTFDARTVSFHGAGIASVGYSGGSVVISVPAGGGAGDGGVFAGVSTGGNTAGSTGTVSTGNLILVGSNGITLSQSTAAAGSHATVTILGDAYTALGYHPYDDFEQVVGQVGNGTLQFDPQILPNVSFDRLGIFLQNTNSSNSSGSHTISFRVGLYTRNAATLSLFTSFSVSTAVTHSGTAGSYSWYSGMRLLALTVGATSISGGRYWIGFVSNTSSAGANGSYSNYMVSNINSQFTGLFGTASNATMQPRLGQGYYTATTNALPNSVAFSQIQGTNSNARRMPVIGFHSSTA